MQEGYKLVRYISDGYVAERKTAVAELLLKKGKVEIIQAPEIKVIESPDINSNKQRTAFRLQGITLSGIGDNGVSIRSINMQEGYKLVRYLSNGFIAERKAPIAERLLRKGLVEIIAAPETKVLASPQDKETDKSENEADKSDEKQPDDLPVKPPANVYVEEERKKFESAGEEKQTGQAGDEADDSLKKIPDDLRKREKIPGEKLFDLNYRPGNYKPPDLKDKRQDNRR